MADSVLVTYQGVPCIATDGAFQFSRTPGWSADRGMLTVPWRDFQRLVVRPLNSVVFPAMHGSSQTGVEETPASQSDILAGGELGIVGPLLLDSGTGADPWLIPDVYLLADGLEEVVPPGPGGDGSIVRIQITDVRYYWSARGLAPAMVWNLPRPGTPGIVGSLAADRYYPAGKNPATGRDWEVQELLSLLLSRLPGRPSLGIVPESVRREIPTGTVWTGAELAVEVARDLADRYGLTPTLDLEPEGSVSFWRIGEGDIGHGYRNGEAIRDDYVIDERRSKAWHFPPTAVKVVGGPSLVEVLSDPLEPIGQLRDGEIVPLEVALIELGLTVEEAGSLVLQPRAEITERLGDEDAARFQLWAYRWYRAGRLPPRALSPIRPTATGRAPMTDRQPARLTRDKSRRGNGRRRSR